MRYIMLFALNDNTLLMHMDTKVTAKYLIGGEKPRTIIYTTVKGKKLTLERNPYKIDTM